jgi:hypothetical protein
MKEEKKDKTYLVFPLLAFTKMKDGSKELTFGWLNRTWYLIF